MLHKLTTDWTPPHPALARIQAHLDHCKELQPGNINEMLCAIEADSAVDTLLNALYGKIVAKLKKAEDPEHDIEDRKELLRRLVASERAWITYREAECSHASADMLGGSGEKTILAQCRLSMRLDRVNTLFRFYKVRAPDIASE
ncbi:lysozyme inhibitor LprI family protein [Bradyrhizobium roseum]|uniref:lysozyme inhibitor LprI family protein n=1 Tax=Bradyrhizobium roseum TaxID=3056648 RepID=UPI002612935B|nr:lysozyme inhibitor LprI family protein [Bradyrhizobium roseus]WKA25478.1 lysozyme inhibitor LprI family protein [Bradyrhizobium roseus]